MEADKIGQAPTGTPVRRKFPFRFRLVRSSDFNSNPRTSGAPRAARRRARAALGWPGRRQHRRPRVPPLVHGSWHRLNRVTMKVRIRENRRDRGARARDTDPPRRAEVPRTRRRPHIRWNRVRSRAASIVRSVGQVTSGGQTCGRSAALIAVPRD